jgi:acyl-CoA synthetase (AMP-forming)/AMP-acid ligase II
MTAQTTCGSLLDVLRHRAADQADDRAYVFIGEDGQELEELTFGELDRRAALAGTSLAALAHPGERAVLIYPPGLEFLIAFFACLYARIIPVPVAPPRRERLQQATLSIVQDCRPVIGLTARTARAGMAQSFCGHEAWHSLQWLSICELGPSSADPGERRDAQIEDLAFLQYTSGSTSAPKGVMVTHRNLLSNLEMIREAFGTNRLSTFVSWVPLHHDMGLILNVLHSLYVGSLCVLMAPAAFMQRPLGWLAAIAKYRAEIAGGPNFAYDLCVERFRPDRADGLDLRHWRTAFNGAEPVRARTLERFAETFAPSGFDARAFYPCYGMAEGTLLLSGGDAAARPIIRDIDGPALARGCAQPVGKAAAEGMEVVGCGAKLVGERLVIVDPETRRECPAGAIGEIWVAGPHVARGYWRNAPASEETFGAFLADSGEGPFLRTGDLGFMLDGELFITGRIKDVMIIRGQNHYPQDIEMTVGACHPALRANFAAAFLVEGAKDPRLVVVQEVERTWRHRVNAADLLETVRQAVVGEHEIFVADLVLIRTGTLPKTTSGKVQRRRTRQLYLEGALDLWASGEPKAKLLPN